jgi:hypothetical protein
MTHAARLVIYLVAGLAACAHDHVTAPPAPLPPDGVIAVDFRTDKTQYVIGGAATGTMVNHSPDTITLGWCNDVLERAETGGWVEIPPLIVACPALAILMAPGDSVTFGLDLRTATTPATYRVRRQFSVIHGTTAESMYRRSNAFAMTR